MSATAHLHQPVDTALRPTLALGSSGMLEVLRVGRMVRKATDLLRFEGVPGSKSSHVHGLEVSFVEGEAPAPLLDAAKGIIQLFYPHRDRAEVEKMLVSRKQRYCYFWRSRDGGQRHAWLLSSPR